MRRDDDRYRRRQQAAGFTLVELLVVIAIIGLIMSLILVAAADGVRRAEERATQSLITKLEAGLNDRLDALLNAQAPINQTHRYLAAINYTPDNGSDYIPVGTSLTPVGGPVVPPAGSASDDRRAQVIAQFDYIRAELPDVFFVHANTSDGTQFASTSASTYPLNFAGAAYPFSNTATSYTQFYLPLGNLSPGLPLDSNNNLVPNNITTPPVISPPFYLQPISGIFGASFSAIGGITKNLGYAPQGYDGIDNNVDGQIDELAEGVPAGYASANDFYTSHVKPLLDKHTHKTARAEMLYAVLVNGVGPLGSVFNADDFTSREVQDTDGDGLPEFVDAWGEPLQFYRWPIYFGGSSVAGASDLQKGSETYSGFSEYRELDPLDANNLLVSPGWFRLDGNPSLTATTSSSITQTFIPPNGPANGESQGALAFMNYFHILVDPNSANITTTNGYGWDRTGFAPHRRAFFSKFLVLSGGPDKVPGVAGFGRDYTSGTTNANTQPFYFPNSDFPPSNPYTIQQTVSYLLCIENQASQTDPTLTARTGPFFEVPDSTPTATTVYLQTNVGLDDISNQNIQAPSTGVR